MALQLSPGFVKPNYGRLAATSSVPLRDFYLPPIRCSFPVKIHPLFEKIREENDEWSVKLVNPETEEEKLHIVAEQMVFLACASYPLAHDAVIGTTVKYVSWLLMYDMIVDNMELHGMERKATECLIREYLEIVENGSRKAPAVQGTTLVDHFSSVWDSMKAGLSKSQQARFRHQFKEFLKSSMKANDHRAEGMFFSSVEEFLAHRRLDSNLTFLVDLVEYELGIELDAALRSLPEVQEIKVTVVDHMCCANDLLSFRVEHLRDDFHNLPSVIAISQNVSLQEAIVETCKIVKTKDDKFKQLYDSITTSSYCTPELRAYLDGLGHIMAGNLEWSWRTPRYHGLNWIPPKPSDRQGIMYMQPSNSSAVFKPCCV